MTERRRIGLLLAAHPHGGGTFQYNLAMLDAVAALPRGDFEPVIVCTNSHWLEHVRQSGHPATYVAPNFWGHALSKLRGASVLPVAWWRRLLSPHVHSIPRMLVRSKCDLWIFPSQEPWAYLTPVPALAAIHDLMHRYEGHFPEVAGKGISTWDEYRWREKHYTSICRWATGILVDSAVGKSHVQESYRVPPDRVHVLPFVAPPYMFDSPTEADLDRRYKLPQRFIFYPAQFWEHKNHNRLVKAVASLREEIPDLQLVFVGSPKNGYSATQRLVHDLGLSDRVRFIGYVPNEDMPEMYRRARALVMPTFFGPTNIPPLEAMAVGCPVAGSRIYAMPEQLGDAALYFDPWSVEEIARTIQRLWEDDALCEELSRRGLLRSNQWTQAHFNERLRVIIDNTLG
jgi:glycosyltransferase involved in cell wall biosynthesis